MSRYRFTLSFEINPETGDIANIVDQARELTVANHGIELWESFIEQTERSPVPRSGLLGRSLFELSCVCLAALPASVGWEDPDWRLEQIGN